MKEINDILDGMDSMNCWYVNFKGGDTKDELFFRIPKKVTVVCRGFKVSLMGRNADKFKTLTATILYDKDVLKYRSNDKSTRFKDWDVKVDWNTTPGKIVITMKSSKTDAIGSKPERLLYLIFHGYKGGSTTLRMDSGKYDERDANTSNLQFELSGGAPKEEKAKTYFSPAGGAKDRILKEIKDAKSTIDLAMYDFTSTDFAKAIIEAKKRGVKIRIILDRTRADLSYSMYNTLKEAGISIKLQGSKEETMHNKYMVIDGMLLMTGSYNFTNFAEEKNDENAIFLTDLDLIEAYEEAFSSLFKK